MDTASDNADTLGRVTRSIASALSIDEREVTSETAFGSVPQWDSMGHMTIVLAIEQEFGCVFESYQIADLTSVRSIVSAIVERRTAS